MNTRLCKIALTVLVVLLASCGTVATETEQAEQVDRASPTVAPSATPAPVRSTDEVQRITPAEVKPLLDSGQAILYDTRSAESYRTQHAAGAVSFPEADVGARFSELPDDKALVFY